MFSLKSQNGPQTLSIIGKKRTKAESSLVKEINQDENIVVDH